MASKLKLFESDGEDSDPENCQLKINTEYAKKFTARKEKEELQKLIETHGDVSESSSSEDEDMTWNAEFDKEFLRVLSAVKSKDPRIYDKDFKFVRGDSGEEGSSDEVDEEDSSNDDDKSSDSGSEKESTSKKKKKKEDGPLTIREHQMRVVTERDGVLSDSEEDEQKQAADRDPSNYEKQQAIKKSFQEAVADLSSDDENGGILTKRIKSKKEKKQEELDYLLFLKGEKKKEELKKRDQVIAKDLENLREWYCPKEGEDDEAKRVIWETLICRGPLKEEEPDDLDDDVLEEEQELKELEEEEEEFERAYNFRYEEPDKDFIKQYKRNPEDSVRQKDNKRAQKRKEVQERKKKEEDKKRQEIRRLRELKRKEVEGRLQRLQKECPLGVEFSAHDLKGDFDPVAHDKMMQEKFSKMYEDDNYDDDDEEKPDMADLDDIISLDSYEDYENEEDRVAEDFSQEEEDEKPGPSGLQAEQEKDSDVHAGYDPSWLPDMSQLSRRARRRRRRKSEKPLFSEVSEKYKDSATPLDDYLKEYYSLDYKEHGFHYRSVVPNNYGVDPAEILWLPARELNSWVSMKKVMEQKSEADELYDKRKYQSTKQQKKILNIMPSLKNIQKEESQYEDIRPSILRQQKMEQLVAEQTDSDNSDMSDSEQPAQEDLGVSFHTNLQTSPKKKKKRKADPSESTEESPARKKKKKSAGNSDQFMNSDQEREERETLQTDEQGGEGKKKKKKKNLKAVEDKEVEDVTIQREKGVAENQTEVHVGGKKKKKKVKPETLTGEVKEKKGKDKESRKKTKKSKGEGKPQSLTKNGKTKTKKKGNKGESGTPKQRGYVPKMKIQDSRLAAFNIDPRKFKYTKHRIEPIQSDQV